MLFPLVLGLAAVVPAYAAVTCETVRSGPLSANPLLASIPRDSNVSLTYSSVATASLIVGGNETSFDFESCQSDFTGYTPSTNSAGTTTTYYGHIRISGTQDCLTVPLGASAGSPFYILNDACSDIDDQSQLTQTWVTQITDGYPAYATFLGHTSEGGTYDNSGLRYFAIGVVQENALDYIKVEGRGDYLPEPAGSISMSWDA
ncbi:hypothetical protein CPB85DRAFT_822702 [Mucidula mucida]|nr:hypothetical protein CPB85DRAFT_822702 [Mucidula mucida]